MRICARTERTRHDHWRFAARRYTARAHARLSAHRFNLSAMPCLLSEDGLGDFVLFDALSLGRNLLTQALLALRLKHAHMFLG